MKFWKYSGAGNDFVLLDGQEATFPSRDIVENLCHRKFGIGADGLLFVTKTQGNEFRMNYFNADGGEVEMCGNGARACVHWFCTQNKISSVNFVTSTGAQYRGNLLDSNRAEVTMNELKDELAIDIEDFFTVASSYYVNTGVPHAVYLLNDDQDLNSNDWIEAAPKVRYDKRFVNGCNVNFVKVIGTEQIALRTYERGVEAETLACGTGAVAAARLLKKMKNWNQIEIQVGGGVLSARFSGDDCWLSGPVLQVFSGKISL